MPSPPSGPPASGPRRLPAQPAEIIDRSRSFQFTFEGRSYPAHPGDTIASALAAAGVRTFSRSFKYHRRRGLLCSSGHCPNCLVQVGDEPNVRACQRPVREGLAVCAQNAWPSLDRDLMALSQRGSRLMPVGFYYKTFMRPRALWPLYERILRRAAGLGRIDPRSAPGSFDKQYLHADVAVVGGGPAGISAALGAARRGAKVLLFDDQPAPGGPPAIQPGGFVHPRRASRGAGAAARHRGLRRYRGLRLLPGPLAGGGQGAAAVQAAVPRPGGGRRRR